MSYDIDKSKLAAGMAVVEKLGLVARANPALSADFRAHTAQALFGTIWTRPGLALEERSLITVTALIAMNREHELRLHLRGARNAGITREKLEEVILHLAHYAGWPNAVTASTILSEVWQQMDEETATP
jgi:4-carboxymuconolactone decarboxylase